MKVGRNDPCPCGSGLKYKKCCLEMEAKSQVADFEYLRLRKLESDLIPKLINHGQDVFGEDILLGAWDIFNNLENEDEFDPDSLMNMAFMPWFLFNWTETDPEEVSKEGAPINTTVAESFLKKFGGRLLADERNILDAANRCPFSIYEVVGVQSGIGMTVRDLLRNTEYDVIEKSGSEILKVGHIIFCSVMNLAGKFMNMGTAPYPLPPIYKQQILELRKRIAKKARHKEILTEDLTKFEPIIRLAYLDIVKGMNEQRISLHNTDGDPLVPQKVIFDIESSHDAFHALKHLASIQESEEDLLEEAKVEDGKVTAVEIPWLGHTKHGDKVFDEDPIVLGRVKIDGKRLVAEVNSVKRAERIRTEIESRLGKKANYKATLVEPIEQKLEAMKDKKESVRNSGSPPSKNMPPEVRAHIEEYNRKHWQKWFDIPVPALNNMTPRQATKTEEGRDLLKSLLLHYEQSNEMATNNLLKVDVEALKKELSISW